MDELITLVKVIESRGAIDAHLLDIRNKQSKEWKLYDEIRSGAITSDIQAIDKLYEKDKSATGFKMLKSRLRRKLMNNLFFLDFSTSAFAPHQAQELELQSKIYQAKTLLYSGAYDIAISLLNQVILIADKYEFNDILDLCFKDLIEAYVRVNNYKEFHRIKKLWNELHLKLICERESTSIYKNARIELNRSVSSRKNYLKGMEEQVFTLSKLWLSCKSFITFENYYYLSIWLHELKGEYTQIITLSKLTEDLVETNRINSLRFDIRYNKFIQVYAHLRTHRYEEGLKLASSYEVFFNASSNSWFSHMENYYLLALHSKRYIIARLVLQRVIENNYFSKITHIAQERWALFEAYLQIAAPDEELSLKLQLLVQNLPSYSKDKEGYNVAILVLQIMYFLRKQQLEQFVYRVESFDKYAQKYLKDEFSKRTRLFLKLLILTVQSRFNPVICEKKGRNIFIKLSQTPQPSDGYAEIEIVPYEHLWEIILIELTHIVVRK